MGKGNGKQDILRSVDAGGKKTPIKNPFHDSEDLKEECAIEARVFSFRDERTNAQNEATKFSVFIRDNCGEIIACAKTGRFGSAHDGWRRGRHLLRWQNCLP